MKRALFGGVLISGLLHVAISIQPAMADEVVHFRDDIGALVRTGPDFFEEGQEMFEDEIERLMQPEPATPLLTIDDSTGFDHDAFLELEQLTPTHQPESPQSSQ